MTRRRRNNFDCLRLIGALLVLYSHQFALAGRAEPTILPGQSLGGLGVLIFFSISGYLVQLSWDRDPHAGRFLLRRFLRIWPALAVMVVVCFAVVGPLFAPVTIGAYFRSSVYWGMLANLWFVVRDPAVFATHVLPGINGSIWTIPKEVMCYVALAAAGCAGLLRDARVVLTGLGMLAALYLFGVGGERGLPAMHGSPLFYPMYFAAFFGSGMVIAQWESELRRFGGAALAFAMAAATLAVVSGENVLALWCAVPLLSVWFGWSSWPACNAAGAYGDFSYGLYLYAWPVQQIVVEILGRDTPMAWQLVASLALTLSAAAMSWFLVERFALRVKPRAGTTPIAGIVVVAEQSAPRY